MSIKYQIEYILKGSENRWNVSSYNLGKIKMDLSSLSFCYSSSFSFISFLLPYSMTVLTSKILYFIVAFYFLLEYLWLVGRKRLQNPNYKAIVQ